MRLFAQLSLLLGATILLPSTAAACTWDANLTMTLHATNPSAGFTFSYSPLSCAGYVANHYRILAKAGTSYPSSPTDGVMKSQSPSSCSTCVADLFPHRSQRTYYARIYACLDSTCSDYVGLDAGETLVDTTSGPVTTEQEIWVVEGVTPTNTYGFSIDSDVNAASAFFIPSHSPWGSGIQNRLVVYRNRAESYGKDIEYVITSGGTGWQSFNNPAIWSDYGGYPTYVAGPEDGSTDFGAVSHFWPLVVETGGDEMVMLLGRNHPDDGDPGEHHILSTMGAVGSISDFDLTCPTGVDCCAGDPDPTTGECNWSGTGAVDICADGSTDCNRLENALHGGWMWDYYASGPPDLDTEHPRILFSSEVVEDTFVDADTDDADDVCDPSDYGDPDLDNIFMAEWDGDSWEVATDTAGVCPLPFLNDQHDPTSIAVGGGNYKIYSATWKAVPEVTPPDCACSSTCVDDCVEFDPHEVKINYWVDAVGSVESFSAEPRFFFDDNTSGCTFRQCAAGTCTTGCPTEVDVGCIGDLQGFRDSSHQGLFFNGGEKGQLYAGYRCGSSASTEPVGFNQTGVYFAKLVN